MVEVRGVEPLANIPKLDACASFIAVIIYYPHKTLPVLEYFSLRGHNDNNEIKQSAKANVLFCVLFYHAPVDFLHNIRCTLCVAVNLMSVCP